MQADAGVTTLNTGPGSDTVNIQSTSAATTINTGTPGSDNINVSSTAPTAGGVTSGINGSITVNGSGNDALNIDDSGDTNNKIVSFTSTTLTGVSTGTITYSSLGSLALSLGSGNDTVTLTGTTSGTATSISTGGGNDTVNVKAISSATTINTGAGTNIVEVTSTAPTAGGNLAGLGAALTLIGSSSDTFNLDDAGDSTGRTATLSATALSGISGTINYSGAAALNVYLGTGADTLTVSNTAAATTTTLSTGSGLDTVNLQDDSGTTIVNAGSSAHTINVNATHATTTLNTSISAGNTINVGSLAPTTSNGVVSAIAGALTINGASHDAVTIDDSGNLFSSTSTLTSSTLTGLAPATITYSHLTTLSINTGIAASTVTVASTSNGTSTHLTTGAAADTVNVRTTGSTLVLNTGAGANVVNVGSLAPATGGVVSGLVGSIQLTGSGSDTLNVDNSGASSGSTGHINNAGVVLGIAGIFYSGESAININLGTGDTFTVASTVSTTPVTINALATDSVIVTGNSSLTTINTPAGNVAINLQSNGAATVINNTSMATADTIGIGSTMPTLGGVLDNLAGAITLNGNGSDVVTVDDSGNSSAKTGTLTASTLTGLGTAGITYGGLANLTIDLGLAGNTFTVTQTAAPTSTVLNAGPGNNNITLTDDAGPTTITSGSGNDSYTVANTHGATTINTGDGTDTVAVTTTSAVTSITGGQRPADTVTLANTGCATSVSTGNGNDTVNVKGTGAATNITTGAGTDQITVGSLAPTAGGVLDNITGILTIAGGGATTLTLDDTGSVATKSMVLTSSSVTGLSPAAVNYSTLAALNVLRASANTNVSVKSTASGTTTTIDTGSGTDAFTVAPANGAQWAACRSPWPAR